MTDRSDDKIELLVRSVLAAVDARLAEVRTEIQAVVADVEQRHHDVLAQMQALEHRLVSNVGDGTHMAGGADPLAARMEQATQVLLERIEAMHQRNTIATNERFALINNALEQLNREALVPSAATAVPIASLDAMNAPLRVGPITGQVPVAPPAPLTNPAPEPAPDAATPAPAPIATHVPTTISLPPIPPLTPAPPREPNDSSNEDSEPIDMSRLADLLSERLGHINLPPQQNQN